MSAELIERYRAMAADGASLRGLTILRYAEDIGRLIKEHGARSVLDYGCGAGDAYRSPHKLHKQWGLKWWDVALYDPAFEQHAEMPHGVFDAVLSSDVAEHLPEDEIDAFIALLFKHARKFVWASVCSRPAKKSFPDGVNLHCTLQALDWWRERFEVHAGAVPFYLVESP